MQKSISDLSGKFRICVSSVFICGEGLWDLIVERLVDERAETVIVCAEG
jgi:hypothetical protein